MNYIIVTIIGYAFGCIQTSFIAGKIFLKKDIRELGNGNAGASNATMVFGKKFGLITVVVDILKAIIALGIIRVMFQDVTTEQLLMNYLRVGGLFVILGHNFPFYMNFKGGKGTAALIGVMFGIDWKLGLVGWLTLMAFTLITDYIALGTLALLVVLLLNSIIFHLRPTILIVDMAIIVMSLYKHRLNFIRIKNGEEKKVRKSLFGK